MNREELENRIFKELCLVRGGLWGSARVAADIAEAYAAEKVKEAEESRWVRVDSGILPTDHNGRLCILEDGGYCIAFYTKGGDYDNTIINEDQEPQETFLNEGWYELCEQEDDSYGDAAFKRNVVKYQTIQQ